MEDSNINEDNVANTPLRSRSKFELSNTNNTLPNGKGQHKSIKYDSEENSQPIDNYRRSQSIEDMLQASNRDINNPIPVGQEGHSQVLREKKPDSRRGSRVSNPFTQTNSATPSHAKGELLMKHISQHKG